MTVRSSGFQGTKQYFQKRNKRPRVIVITDKSGNGRPIVYWDTGSSWESMSDGGSEGWEPAGEWRRRKDEEWGPAGIPPGKPDPPRYYYPIGPIDPNQPPTFTDLARPSWYPHYSLATTFIGPREAQYQ